MSHNGSNPDAHVFRGMALLLGAVCSLVLAGICLFGFLASFEPTTNALAFRIGYGVAGVVLLGLTAILLPAGIRAFQTPRG
ncbi:MAG: hypothetical protein VXY94_12640 [Planctomycetota bacterium]|nr:hypothetical protein [Planctomycetota bacterium]MEC8817936.1 hypothetical protein [Planctomycetota bacterium]MEC9156885.1 hypothetical protein [Planctomycetota bacterium]MEC9233065.1 hypothetical protein [Planctomycetota bacterium]MED5506887.1 hypothetical protein [Planctomycetota bacterium]